MGWRLGEGTFGRVLVSLSCGWVGGDLVELVPTWWGWTGDYSGGDVPHSSTRFVGVGVVDGRSVD